MHRTGCSAASREVSVVKPNVWAWLLLPIVLSGGCRDHEGENAGSSAPSAAVSAAIEASPERVEQLLRIEDTRAIREVTEADLSHADPRVRRAAVRALARARNGAARPRLLTTLSDRDPDVLAWSAYGLGQICAWDRDDTARHLITRSIALGVEPPPPAGRLDPWSASSRALGRCANPHAEQTLVAWLSGPKDRGIEAAKGLGSVVTRDKRMGEETAAGLLRASRGDAANDPLSEALYPFGRLKRPPARVEQELLDACRQRIGHNVPARVFVLRALATLGDEAVSTLASILQADTGYAANERAEAARALGKIGTKTSRKALLEAIDKLAPPNDPIALTSLVGPGFGVLTTALTALHQPGKQRLRSKGLDALLALEIPPGAPQTVSRRVGLLRCFAAQLTVGANYDHPKLLSCDPDKGQVGALARLAVLDRVKLVGARLAAYKPYLDTKHPPIVRETAIRMLSGHPEVRQTAEIVATALGDEQLGVLTEAASLLASHPNPFLQEAKGDDEASRKPDARVAKALKEATGKKWPADAIETRGALARACGALRVEDTREWLEQLCKSPNPTLREHAQKALSAFGGPKVTCEALPDHRYEPAAELGHMLSEPLHIELDTEVGKLTIELDPTLAPVAATRVADLVREKFYDDMTVHRVVPGFVVQFGDPQGDGYGGADREALRCETSPVPFDAGVVGVALGGRDTGSSQLFVTLGPAPHLDGEYAVIGKATGAWDSLTEGDRIRSASVAAHSK